MNRGTLTTLLVLLVITALAQSVVIVRDTEKAILLKLGAFERTLDPGLNFKVPFIDNVIKFEGRLRSLDTPPDRVLSNESKPLNVDAFVKYMIVDAETYYTATNGGQTRVAEDTLQRRVTDKIRNEFGKRTLPSSHTSQAPPTSATISGSTSMLAGAPSSCRPPWFETMMESTPRPAAMAASSASMMPLRISLPRHCSCTHATSSQLSVGSSCSADH